MKTMESLDVATLTDRQLARLRLSPSKPIQRWEEMERFLKSVGMALRYHASPTLPLASVYQAAWGGPPENLSRERMRPAIEMTHVLLDRKSMVETNAIADRVCLVHRMFVPALRRLAKENALPPNRLGERILAYLIKQGRASVGELRRSLNVPAQAKHDPLYEALAELQRACLVDRGPASVPKNGIPYLSPEGYPWRAFVSAHPDLEKSSKELSVPQAAQLLIRAYLQGAVFAPRPKLAMLFKRLLSAAQLEEALVNLADAVVAMPVPRGPLYIWDAGRIA